MAEKEFKAGDKFYVNTGDFGPVEHGVVLERIVRYPYGFKEIVYRVNWRSYTGYYYAKNLSHRPW